MTTIVHFSHPEHPLILKEVGFLPEKISFCYACDRQFTEAVGTSSDSGIYSCTLCPDFFLHYNCAHIYDTQITHLKHIQHPLTLQPRMPSLNSCKLCASKSKVFAFRCNPCDFDVCVLCVYISYKEHLLYLKEDVVNVLCDGCHEPLTESTFYKSTTNSGKKYYLHRTCVELPAKINHYTHPDCDLFLDISLPSCRTCDLCFRARSTYKCDPCFYDVCVKCAFKKRVITLEGHKHRSLMLRYPEALFPCHACREKAADSSYTCNECDFWIHESCAFAPSTISATTYHPHPLHLIYSIPEMHQTFSRYCGFCKEYVRPKYWVYYCHRCTYFVHMRCATSPDAESMIKEIEGDCANDDPSLVQFPLPSEESLFDLLIRQFSKSQIESKEVSTTSSALVPVNPKLKSVLHRRIRIRHYSKSQIESKEVSSTSSVVPEDPPYVDGQHWSHMDHQLQELHLSTFKDEEEDDEDDDQRLMVCDGCIQPISDAHPSFYGCKECRFFLHKFCASILPRKLPAGASPFHPKHSLLLKNMDKFYDLITCVSCDMATNGFYYHCETCNINVDIHCTFLPSSIKYEAHKCHPLVQRAASNSKCNISKMETTEGLEYRCKSCSSFRIRKACIFYPSRMKHRWDSHTVTLRYPPFPYEGVFYCQICEQELNNNKWLYHCDDCDQSFHTYCLRPLNNVKLGQTILLRIDNQKHTLTFVLKVLKVLNYVPYLCSVCGNVFRNNFMLECAGCGFLVCIECFRDRLPRDANASELRYYNTTSLDL